MIKADYKKIGYRFLDNDIVEFYCDKELYEEILPNEDVYITASFNGWLSTGDSSWKLAKKEEKHKTYFVLQKIVHLFYFLAIQGFQNLDFLHYLMKALEFC